MKTVEQWLEENPDLSIYGGTAAMILERVREYIREEEARDAALKARAREEAGAYVRQNRIGCLHALTNEDLCAAYYDGYLAAARSIGNR